MWSFDPARSGRLFEPRDEEKATLRITLSSDEALRLFSKGDRGETWVMELDARGDADALRRLSAAMIERRSPIAVRSSLMGGDL